MRRMFMMPSEYRAYYNNVTHKFGQDQYEADKLYYGSWEVYGPIMPDNTWHRAVVTDPVYMINSWGGLKKYLKKLLLTRTTIVRDSRYMDRDMF
jgi:hypothetical protein